MQLVVDHYVFLASFVPRYYLNILILKVSLLRFNSVTTFASLSFASNLNFLSWQLTD